MYEITTTTNCNDEPVYAYQIDGVAIYNPTMSECGRFKVDPLKEYGLTVAQVQALHDLNVAHGFDDSI